MEYANNTLISNPQGKRPLGKAESTRENIKTDLKETGCGLNSSGSGQALVAASCEHESETSDPMNDTEFLLPASPLSASRDSFSSADLV
jgi:hypothetical protein